MKKTLSVILAVLMLGMTALPCFAALKPCKAYGDVNISADEIFANDGVDIEDARLILRNSIGIQTFTENQQARADIDANGKINVADARIVLRIALGKQTAPVHPVSVVNPGKGSATDADSEYNILGGDKYIISATITENGTTSSPMCIARNGNDVYLETSITEDQLGVDDETAELLGEIFPITFGIVVKDGKTYMVTKDHKYSLEYTDSVMETLGMTEKDLASMTDPSQYTFALPDISTATKVESEIITCPLCGTKIRTGKTIYTFGDDINRLEVYMNGKELLKTVEYKYGVVTSTMEFDYVTADVPDSYFALPSSKLNQYPTALQTSELAVLSFFSKVLDIDITGFAKLL